MQTAAMAPVGAAPEKAQEKLTTEATDKPAIGAGGVDTAPPASTTELAPTTIDVPAADAPPIVAEPTPAATEVAILHPPAVPSPEAEARALRQTIDALLERGREMLAISDVSAARRLFERAANLGEAKAATLVGMTFDPSFLDGIVARGFHADTARAARWYERAIEAGDREAKIRLDRLRAKAKSPPARSGDGRSEFARLAAATSRIVTTS